MSGHGPSGPTTPRIDVSAWIGEYPFRAVPHPEPAVLAERVLEREGFSGAWVGHLPGAFHRDPVPSNRVLYRALAPHRSVLQPAPIVRPDWPGWERTLDEAVQEGAPSVRVYPAQWGMGVGHPALGELATACGEAGVVLHATVRFEDLRQRHHTDIAGDLSAAHLRGIARLPGSRCHLVVAGAGRELIEETHFGLTESEASRVWYDFSWLWGPPEDHFALLVRSLGPARLCWGSYWPLRLVQQPRALVALLPEELLAGESTESFGVRFSDGASIAASARSAAVRAAGPDDRSGR